MLIKVAQSIDGALAAVPLLLIMPRAAREGLTW